MNISMPELHPGVGACGRRPLRVRRPREGRGVGGRWGSAKLGRYVKDEIEIIKFGDRGAGHPEVYE